jgi:uncharacterized protein (DUF779 family)
MDPSGHTGPPRGDSAPAETTVVLTEAAGQLVERVRDDRGEDLAMVIGNGCCDSTAPYLFAHHVTGPGEVPLGEVSGVPVYLDRALAGSFAGREIVVDAVQDPQPDSFSCESELGWRFLLDRLPFPG